AIVREDDDEKDEDEGEDKDEEEDEGEDEEDEDDKEKAPGRFKSAKVDAERFVAVAPGKAWGAEGWVLLSAEVDGDRLTGTAERADGSRDTFEGRRTEKAEEKEKKKKEKDVKSATFAVNYPLGTYGRAGLPEPGGTVLFANATVWTSAEAGILRGASVLIKDGVIAAVGTDVEAPAGARVIDLTGRHLTPGLIDAHSHIATDSTNESGQANSAEVRIGDMINPEHMNIYRQLAGGLTASHIMHGSANPIGGQNQTIKMRWGGNAEDLKFAGAGKTIKFALGENVKQSRNPDGTRYPRTRMGVERYFADQLTAALEYKAAWEKWRSDRRGVPPRRDLELDALVEVLEGDRLVHCHSYQQGEILALIRLMERFNTRVFTFQHVLEGYKVAEAIRDHGAMASSFSDWWAYKFEVIDGIPYSGALMHRAGVVVSYNSDDSEIGRRMNLEAAKAVKYGGVKRSEALKFVTINAAKQLKIDHRVGSIEVGKDADLAIWNRSPLSNYTRCEQTWIDGRRYFDHEEEAKRHKEHESMRRRLIQKVLEDGS
ncbi:MAG: amidohydrolase, partial [Planctomycetota bacterium]